MSTSGYQIKGKPNNDSDSDSDYNNSDNTSWKPATLVKPINRNHPTDEPTKEPVFEVQLNTNSPRQKTNGQKENTHDWHWLKLPELSIRISTDISFDNDSNEFLFIVKNKTVFGVYETKSKFTLTKSYYHKPNEQYLSIIQHNFISTVNDTYNKGNIRSVLDNYNKNISKFNTILNYQHIVSCNTGEKVDIFIYLVDNKNIISSQQYSTVGDVFIYNNGIMSTQEINIYNTNVCKFVVSNILNKTEYLDMHKTITHLVHDIQKQLNKIPDIYYINALPPDSINSDVFNILYIKIFQLKIDDIYHYNEYVELLKYIDYFYWYKSKTNEYNCELIKEHKFYNKNKTQPGSPFSMHIFDFLYLMAFIDNKIDSSKIIQYCDKLIELWKTALPVRNQFVIENVNKIKTTMTNKIKTYLVYNDTNIQAEIEEITGYQWIKYGELINKEIKYKNTYGPFTNAFNNKNTVSNAFDNLLPYLSENAIVIWFGEMPTLNKSINVFHIKDEHLIDSQVFQDINTIVNIKNGNNPYFIPHSGLTNIECIDEYCNSKIGCFSVKIGNPLLSSMFKDKITDINSLINNDVIIVGNINTNKKPYIDINMLKSIIYNKDVYAANSFIETNYNSSQKVTSAISSAKLFINNRTSVINAVNKTNQAIQKINKNAKEKPKQHEISITNIESFNKLKFEPDDINKLNKELEVIDKLNKHSSQGILEILDSISKLGRVNTFCKK